MKNNTPNQTIVQPYTKKRSAIYTTLFLGIFAGAAYAITKGDFAPSDTSTQETTRDTTSSKGGYTYPGTGTLGDYSWVSELAPPGTMPPSGVPPWMDTLAPGSAVGDAPLPPRHFTITGYAPQSNDPTRSRISMAWDTNEIFNPYDVTSVVLRVNPGGSGYTTLAYYETVPANELRTFTDENAIAGQYNCYIVVHRNSVTSSSSDRLCVFGPSSSDVKVSRARVEIRVGDVGDGGTDSALAVAMQPASYVSTTYPRGNMTWLDTQYDDFERGDRRTYELLLNNVSMTSDVTTLRVEVSGDDDVCISDLSLRLNEDVVFTKNYSPCVWVGDKNPLYEEIRPDGALPPVFGRVYTSYEYLDETMEAIVGDALHGESASWNQVSGRNPQGYAVDETHRFYRVWLFGPGYFPFELEVLLRAESGPCVAGTPQILSIVVEYADTDADEWLSFLEPLADLIVDYLPELPSTSFENPLGCGRLVFDEVGLGLVPL